MELSSILDLAYRQALQDMREELEFIIKYPNEQNIERYLDAKETVKQIVDIAIGDAEVQ